MAWMKRMISLAFSSHPAAATRHLRWLVGLPTEPLPRARARVPTGQESFDFDAA